MSIGIVNLNRLLDESKRGRALSQRLKAVLDGYNSELMEISNRIEKARAGLAKAPPNMPAESLHKMQRDLRVAETEQRHRDEMRRLDVETQREQARAVVLRELDPLLAQLAAERNLTLVLAVPSREVAFAAPSIDLTEELLKRYDAK
jgi:outer membrane protein